MLLEKVGVGGGFISVNVLHPYDRLVGSRAYRRNHAVGQQRVPHSCCCCSVTGFRAYASFEQADKAAKPFHHVTARGKTQSSPRERPQLINVICALFL